MRGEGHALPMVSGVDIHWGEEGERKRGGGMGVGWTRVWNGLLGGPRDTAIVLLAATFGVKRGAWGHTQSERGASYFC